MMPLAMSLKSVMSSPSPRTANINVWNRLNVTTRQVAGQEW
jgi:hypothetical protein